MQSRVSLSGGERRLFVVAAELEPEMVAQCDLGSSLFAGKGARFQLAECEWMRVRSPGLQRGAFGGGDCLHVGGESRVSHRRRNAARTACQSTGCLWSKQREHSAN